MRNITQKLIESMVWQLVLWFVTTLTNNNIFQLQYKNSLEFQINNFAIKTTRPSVVFWSFDPERLNLVLKITLSIHTNNAIHAVTYL